MAGGGAGASSPSSSLDSLPPLSTEEATTPSAPPPPAGGGQDGGPRPLPPLPPLTGGEFLLHLLQRRPQFRADRSPPPPSAASGSGGRGVDHEDPAVAAVGPSVPFLRPPPAGGFPAAAAPVNPHPHGPPPWAGPGYPGFHQAPWAAPSSEFGPPRQPPPPGFHHRQQYSHHYNKYNASQVARAASAFSPPLGFLAGPFDASDLHRNPGHSQHRQHQHQQQPPRRDGFPMEGTPLLFGSLASAGSGRFSQCNPFLLDKVDTSSRGVHVRPNVLNAHSVAHNASTGYDHERERVLDSGRSFVFGGFPGPNWTLQPKAHQRPSHQWRESGDGLGQKQQGLPQHKSVTAEPGKLPRPQKKAKDVKKQVPSSNGRNGEHTLEELADLRSGEPKNLSCNREFMLSRDLQSATQLGDSSPSLRSETHSVLASDAKEHRENLHFNNVSVVQRVEQMNDEVVEGLVCINDSNEKQDLLSEHLVDSLELADEIAEKRVEAHVHASRGKDYRSDFSRGHHVLSQRMRYRRSELRCRRNIACFMPFFLAIYESLVPSEEEKAKQSQLLQSLQKLVIKEWPNARLHLYGSCANSFGVSNSDIDVCLAIDDNDINKSEILLKLADILQSDNLQNVQALTRARVPIVKLMDPVTGISCDICINNILAVVNTKLLRDYAQIDDRLRQLVFIVKHWAKSRGVNDTYQGTLSSYAYVLMCIHFLQLRKPAILPCLQEMEATYVITVDDIECAFFDQVEKLHDFGAENRENIAELLWAFFSYWAYHHDYANDVISVRTGGIMSKQSKNWTRRIGNDRHLICIEDPFELSHDLGRVVDRYTIKILREEFERAAEIMQCDPNPSVKLFEPYVRVSEQG